MNTLTESPETTELAPLPAGQRIQALDAVRGFALLGICVMNIEFFNRAPATLGNGMPTGLTGIDWLASYFVAYFVAGKFWTIFSLLFGMGFAVMLTRAERAGRDFLKPYIRRIAALAAFGAAHHIFLYAGDILFSYAVSAVYLLIVLYAKPKWLIAAIAVAVGLAFIPGWGPGAGAAAGVMTFSGVVALYMRSEKRAFGLSIMSAILCALALLAGIAATIFWLAPGVPSEPRGPLTAMTVLFLILAFIAQKYRNPVEARPWRAGAAAYLLMATFATIGGLVDYLTPPEAPVPVVASAPAVAKAEPKKGAVKAAPSEAEKKAIAAAERQKQMKEKAAEVANETKVMSSGSYAQLVVLRAKHFAEHAPMESGFATILIGMFLLGTWFIRSGVMENSAAHLPLFRKFAYIYLPLGIGIGVAGSFIATTHVPGAQHDGFFLAHSLLMLGNLAACLGYVGMIVLMLNSSGAFARVRVLAPFGRMALTNYLTQSLVLSLFFLGHGLAWWGLGRAWQLVFAMVLCGVQIAFSHWWLARFRYGPAEWLWRAITYMKIPAMRIEPAQNGLQGQLSH